METAEPPQRRNGVELITSTTSSTVKAEEDGAVYCSTNPVSVANHDRLYTCGCIPAGIPSLFEMAEKRKKYRAEQERLKQQQQTQ